MISNCNLTLQSAMNPCWPSFKKPRIYTFIFLARRVRYWKFINPRRILNESHILGAGNVLIGARRNAVVLSVHDRMRENLRGKTMIYFTAVVAAFLFVYLFAALIRPEWF
jgi:K+-transporting ATPase KdpF subunit